MTHDELQEDLAAHIRGAGDRMVWTNTQLGPSGSPRPDVFTVANSFARFRCDCYEIKVSVSDLRSDVTSGKWQSYRKFGHAVWFAFPRGMVPLDLVPKECGVMLRGESWRAARKPVAQVMDTLPRDVWLKLLMADFNRGPSPKARRIDEWTIAAMAGKRFGKEVAQILEDRSSAKRAFEHATARLQAKTAAVYEEIAAADKRVREREAMESQRVDQAMQNLGAFLGLTLGEVTAQGLSDALHATHRKLRAVDFDRVIKNLESLREAVLVHPAGEPA